MQEHKVVLTGVEDLPVEVTASVVDVLVVVDCFVVVEVDSIRGAVDGASVTTVFVTILRVVVAFVVVVLMGFPVPVVDSVAVKGIVGFSVVVVGFSIPVVVVEDF